MYITFKAETNKRKTDNGRSYLLQKKLIEHIGGVCPPPPPSSFIFIRGFLSKVFLCIADPNSVFYLTFFICWAPLLVLQYRYSTHALSYHAMQ